MILQTSVFKAYDIRGVYGKEFDAGGAAHAARAFGAFLFGGKKGTLVVGRDARPSSEPIVNAVLAALCESGIEVFDIGLATTPLFYFAINHFKAGGGLMITASHNPPQFNGLKLCREKAIAVGAGSGMEEIRELALSGGLFPKAISVGGVRHVEALTPYIAFLKKGAKFSRPLRIVIDPGNGMAGLVLERLLPLLPQLSVQKLHFAIDGTFPNHLANPLIEETLVDIKRELRTEPYDCGIAFDADGDRVGFLTSDGTKVRGDFVTALLAQQALANAEPNAKVLYDVRSSLVVKETIRAHGGMPVLTPSGHASMNRTMREQNALLAGELSGHYYFRDVFFRDDAMVAALRILQMLLEGKKLSELIAPLAKYVQSGERNFEAADKQAAIRRVADAFSDGKQSNIDGLTVAYDDWWFNLRASNTEDLLRLNVEANTPELLEKKIPLLQQHIGSKPA